MRQLFYYKTRQKFITKCVRFFITKCNSFITKCDVYYKLRQYNKESEENSDVNETTKSSPANDRIQSHEDTSTFANKIAKGKGTKRMICMLIVNKRMELMKNEINFLREECYFKTKLINPCWRIFFNHENHLTKLHNGNTTLTPNEAEDDYQFPKQQACKRKF